MTKETKALNLMFEEPKHGWTTFNLDKYKGDNYSLSKLSRNTVRASYIGPLASTMFKMLIDNFSVGVSSQQFTYFDAEGWFWGLGITAYGPAIMLDEDDDADDAPLFSVYPLECTERQLAEDWLECWQAYKDEWVRWTIDEFQEDELDGIQRDEFDSIKSSLFQTRLQQLETQENTLKLLLEKRYGDKNN